MKSLPWADADNYRIEFDEQHVKIRVPDMARFDEKQLLHAFHQRDLVPGWIEEIRPLSPVPVPDSAVAAHKLLKPLAREWRTDESAPRKFWLDVKAGTICLHTTKLGFWSSTRTPIISVDNHTIRTREADRDLDIAYTLQGDALTIRIPPPSVYQGEFKLLRHSDR